MCVGIDRLDAVETPGLVIVHSQLSEGEETSQVLEFCVLRVISLLIEQLNHFERFSETLVIHRELAIRIEHLSPEVEDHSIQGRA